MSYSVSVLGYGYSRELEAEGPLTDALSKLDAKFSSFDMGSFLYEIGGMKHKEVDGGFYSWMLYKADESGSMMPAQEGVGLLTPKPGERIYVVYQFFPSSAYKEREVYEMPDLSSLLKEPEPLRYQFVPPEEYELPELFEYGGPAAEPSFETVSIFEEEEEKERPILNYSAPEFTLPTPMLQETYQVVRPLPTPLRMPIPDFQDNGDLERFLMELLSEARFASLLATIASEDIASEEEHTAPLVRV